DWPEYLVVRWRLEEPGLEMRTQIAWPRGLVRQRVTYRCVQGRHPVSFPSFWRRDTTTGTGRAYCTMGIAQSGNRRAGQLGPGDAGGEARTQREARRPAGQPAVCCDAAGGTRRDSELRHRTPRPPRPDDLPTWR